MQRGAYHAHPECIILAMLSDENDSVRNKGVDMVIKLRDGSDVGDTSVREFRVPELNWLAEDYTQIIDFSSVSITEPVLTAHLTLAEIEG